MINNARRASRRVHHDASTNAPVVTQIVTHPCRWGRTFGPASADVRLVSARRRRSVACARAAIAKAGSAGRSSSAPKAQVCDNDDGIVLDHTVEASNPVDAPRLEPAIKRVIGRTGRKLPTLTADRGYGEQSAPHLRCAN